MVFGHRKSTSRSLADGAKASGWMQVSCRLIQHSLKSDLFDIILVRFLAKEKAESQINWPPGFDFD